MRYHYEIPEDTTQIAGETYICDHPIYSRGTLFKAYGRGLVVIQQRFNKDKKITWWSEIDPWLASELFRAPMFAYMFDQYAAIPTEDLYPTITVRQAMAFLKIKPLPKPYWETIYDRKPL